MISFLIKPIGQLSKQVIKLGVTNSLDLVSFIQNIPYGRTVDRGNLALVLTENKGTCSSKHALIKAIAMENGITDLKLIIGIYKMTEKNTPKIGQEIAHNNLDYLPEAHCYLKYDNETIDITSANADFDKIKSVILEEIEIEPQQVGQFKIDYHKTFIQKWITDKNLSFSLDEIWTIREQCIANLSS